MLVGLEGPRFVWTMMHGCQLGWCMVVEVVVVVAVAVGVRRVIW